MAQPEPQAPYQPYGGEGMNYGTDAAADSGFDAFDGAAAAAAGAAANSGGPSDRGGDGEKKKKQYN